MKIEEQQEEEGKVVLEHAYADQPGSHAEEEMTEEQQRAAMFEGYQGRKVSTAWFRVDKHGSVKK